MKTYIKLILSIVYLATKYNLFIKNILINKSLCFTYIKMETIEQTKSCSKRLTNKLIKKHFLLYFS
jgi:hypothetical protein